MAGCHRMGDKRQRNSGRASDSLPRLTLNELLFQPWFLPKRVAFAIRGLIPRDYYLKMRYLFDDYGCMICKKDYNYGSNGMCFNCCRQVRKKLMRSVRLRAKPKSERHFDLGLIRQEKLARKILRNCLTDSVASRQRNRIGGIRPANPVDEALSPQSQRI
jgi:hypothetical protein